MYFRASAQRSWLVCGLEWTFSVILFGNQFRICFCWHFPPVVNILVQFSKSLQTWKAGNLRPVAMTDSSPPSVQAWAMGFLRKEETVSQSRRKSTGAEWAVGSNLPFSFYHKCSRMLYLRFGKLWESHASCSSPSAVFWALAWKMRWETWSFPEAIKLPIIVKVVFMPTLVNWVLLSLFWALWYSHLKISFPSYRTEFTNTQLCGKILLYEENSHLYLRDRFSSAVKKRKRKIMQIFSCLQLLIYF